MSSGLPRKLVSASPQRAPRTVTRSTMRRTPMPDSPEIRSALIDVLRRDLIGPKPEDADLATEKASDGDGAGESREIATGGADNHRDNASSPSHVGGRVTYHWHRQPRSETAKLDLTASTLQTVAVPNSNGLSLAVLSRATKL